MHSVIIFCCAQLSWNFLKIGNSKKGAFFCLKFSFCCCFLCWPKHYENRGFSKLLCLCCLKRRKRQKQNDDWNFWIWVFCSKTGRFVTHNLFQRKVCWNPYFYSVLGVRAFWAKLSNKEILDTHQKRIFWLIMENLILGHFFNFFSLFPFFCCYLRV